MKLLIICPSGSMYMENRMGPKTDPWGTLHDKAAVSDTNSPTETDKDLSVRYEENHSNAVPDQNVMVHSIERCAKVQ